MASKTTFSSLKLKIISDVKTITINDKTIEVKQYLPAEDKNSILELAMQEADHGTVTNTLALDMLFHLYIVFKYTNLTFTDAQKENLFKLYDILETNGVITEVLKAIPEAEYDLLYKNLNEMLEAYNTYRNSARAVFEQVQMLAPTGMSQLAGDINQMDTDKLEKLVSIASNTGVNLL